jgi:hypothetical protein
MLCIADEDGEREEDCPSKLQLKLRIKKAKKLFFKYVEQEKLLIQNQFILSSKINSINRS